MVMIVVMVMVIVLLLLQSLQANHEATDLIESVRKSKDELQLAFEELTVSRYTTAGESSPPLTPPLPPPPPPPHPLLPNTFSLSSISRTGKKRTDNRR